MSYLPTYLLTYLYLPTYVLFVYYYLLIIYQSYLFIYLPTKYLPTYLLGSVPTNLFMKKIEVQTLLYTLTKKFMEVQRYMLNPFHIILFYKVVGCFDCQDISVEQRKLRFNSLYQHILRGICIFVYIPCICVNV
jgi:hypothetical protein